MLFRSPAGPGVRPARGGIFETFGQIGQVALDTAYGSQNRQWPPIFAVVFFPTKPGLKSKASYHDRSSERQIAAAFRPGSYRENDGNRRPRRDGGQR